MTAAEQAATVRETLLHAYRTMEGTPHAALAALDALVARCEEAERKREERTEQRRHATERANHYKNQLEETKRELDALRSTATGDQLAAMAFGQTPIDRVEAAEADAAQLRQALEEITRLPDSFASYAVARAALSVTGDGSVT